MANLPSGILGGLFKTLRQLSERCNVERKCEANSGAVCTPYRFSFADGSHCSCNHHENAPHVRADHNNAGARGECPRLLVSLGQTQRRLELATVWRGPRAAFLIKLWGLRGPSMAWALCWTRTWCRQAQRVGSVLLAERTPLSYRVLSGMIDCPFPWSPSHRCPAAQGTRVA